MFYKWLKRFYGAATISVRHRHLVRHRTTPVHHLRWTVVRCVNNFHSKKKQPIKLSLCHWRWAVWSQSFETDKFSQSIDLSEKHIRCPIIWIWKKWFCVDLNFVPAQRSPSHAFSPTRDMRIVVGKQWRGPCRTTHYNYISCTEKWGKFWASAQMEINVFSTRSSFVWFFWPRRHEQMWLPVLFFSLPPSLSRHISANCDARNSSHNHKHFLSAATANENWWKKSKRRRTLFIFICVSSSDSWLRSAERIFGIGCLRAFHSTFSAQATWECVCVCETVECQCSLIRFGSIWICEHFFTPISATRLLLILMRYAENTSTLKEIL